MAKLMFSNSHCVGCGLCARFCPNHGVVMRGRLKKKRPYWTWHCELCLRCMGFCHKKAIEAGHSWAIILYFITAIPVITYLLSALQVYFPFIPSINGYWAKEFSNLFYFMPALFLSYWLFWQLIRIPLINSFFTFTTLTHYYRRYHEPGTRSKEMAGPLHKER